MQVNCVVSFIVGLQIVAFVGMQPASQTAWAQDPLKPHKTMASLERALVDERGELFVSDSTAGDAEPLPPEVAASIQRVAEKWYDHYIESGEANTGYFPMGSFYGPVFRLGVCDDPRLYVFKSYPMGRQGIAEELCYFLLFDPVTRKVTSEPFSITMRWFVALEGFDLLRKPLVHFFDLDQDGQRELVIEQIVHNGTMYNAAVYHYFHIERDMSLVRRMAFEARVVDLFSDEEGMLVRTLELLGENRIKINVALQLPAGTPHQQQVGEIVLERKDNSATFQVVQKDIKLVRYARGLLTMSGIEDQAFLAGGYGHRGQSPIMESGNR